MRLMFISIGCIWMSVVFVFVGAHQRNRSARFPEYERSESASFRAANPDSPGLPVAIASNPNFETALAILIAMTFSVGVIFSRSLVRLGWWLTLVVPVVFALGCLAGAIVSFIAGVQDGILWRFVILGLGEWLAAVGLAGGAAVILDEFSILRNGTGCRWLRKITSFANGET